MTDGTDNKALWTVSDNYDFVNKYNSDNNINSYLRNNGTYGFACYGTSTGGALSLYKKVVEPETNITQTIELVGGQWNWISSYIDLGDPVALIQMLEAGLEDNATEIQSNSEYTEFDGEEWFGDLDDTGIENERMYVIFAENDCTVELTGPAADPANYTITIQPQQWTWIGFPCSEEVEINAALADLEAEEGDQIQTSTDMTEFDGEEWFGDIETLVPGTGFVYYSNSTEVKTFVFQTTTKARNAKSVSRKLTLKRQPVVMPVTSEAKHVKSPYAKQTVNQTVKTK